MVIAGVVTSDVSDGVVRLQRGNVLCVCDAKIALQQRIDVALSKLEYTALLGVGAGKHGNLCEPASLTCGGNVCDHGGVVGPWVEGEGVLLDDGLDGGCGCVSDAG